MYSKTCEYTAHREIYYLKIFLTPPAQGEVIISHVASLGGSFLLKWCGGPGKLSFLGSFLAFVGWLLASGTGFLSALLNLPTIVFLSVGQSILCGSGYGFMYFGAVVGVDTTFLDAGLPMGWTSAGSALGQMIGGPAINKSVVKYGWALTYRSEE